MSGLHEFFGHGLSISNKRAEKNQNNVTDKC